MDAETEQVLRHRVRAHIAALRTAQALGNPAILAAQVAATRARLAEVRAILDELEPPRLDLLDPPDNETGR